MSEPTLTAELEALCAALELLSLRYEDQRAFLPPSGYTEEGVVSECADGLRDAMWSGPALLRGGGLSPSAAGDVLECYLRMEGLLRDPATRTPRAFAEHPEWQRVRALAGAALTALRPG